MSDAAQPTAAEVRAAAEEYDELLYDRYDEVTPFEIPGSDDALPPYTGPEEPNALSVLIRRDYAVVEPQRLLAQAQRVEAVEESGAVTAGFDAASGTVHGALGVLFGEFEPDEIASRHKEFGLEEGDSTLWVTASDEPADPGEWLEAPFDQADTHQVVCRFDVSAVFDDDADDGIDDLDDLEDEVPDTAEPQSAGTLDGTEAEAGVEDLRSRNADR
ncbi:hypothetical protein ACFW9L_29020 [Streptomyces sp. NPDC059517]|uniref:hypothetical protein n=1 Tax=Streptomyces sp. NPDC059517 TaxID=3346855 RepID=UPI00367F5216